MIKLEKLFIKKQQKYRIKPIVSSLEYKIIL